MGRGLSELLILGILLLSNSVMAEDGIQKVAGPVRLGMGVGIPYGIFGLNLGLRLGDIMEATGGYGTAHNGFKGWAIGGRLYPFQRPGTFRPRLSAFYGVVGIVTNRVSAKRNVTVDIFRGLALGVGFDGLFFVRHSIDFDLFYTDAVAPEKYKRNNQVRQFISIGYGYHF
jgi:hypothetical protein